MTHERIEADHINDSSSGDGVDRRASFLCVAGAELVWTFSGGSVSQHFGAIGKCGDHSFAQISNSSIGLDKAANSDMTASAATCLTCAARPSCQSSSPSVW